MNLIQPFIDLCLFKTSPADIPPSRWLLRIILAIYLVLGAVIGLLDTTFTHSVISSISDTAMMIFLVWLLLKVRGYGQRYQQVLTAMAGTGVVIGLVGIPILWLFHQVEESQRATSYVMLPVIALLFWNLMVTAHIFRSALDIKPGIAAIITVIYTVLTLIGIGLVNSGVA